MATQVVQMDYKVVGEVSKGFALSRDMLNAVAKVLEVLIEVLRSLAFVSLGTTEALAQYLENIKSKIQNLANICNEFSNDLAQAIDDHKRGDIKGKHYFGEGVSR